MPLYNAERYLDEAIESVLAQTFRDFELLVLDDGSTDGSAAVVERYLRRDARLRLYRFPHRGLVACLNDGLELARGEYVARADADDRSLPGRLEAQCAYMDRNLDIGISGTSMRVMDGYVWRARVDAEEIRCQLLFGVPMPHGSWMVRRSWLLTSGLKYDADYTHAEDYDLLERAAHRTKLGNVTAVLYEYRVHAAQVSSVHAGAQAERSQRIRARQLARLGISPAEMDLDVHRQICDGVLSCGVGTAVHWIECLIVANERAQLYAPEKLRRVSAEYLYRACLGSRSLRPWTVVAFRRSGIDEEVCRSVERSLWMVVYGCLPERGRLLLLRAVRWFGRRRSRATPLTR